MDKTIRPEHYLVDDPYEAISVMLAWHGREEVVVFCRLTALKYLARAGKKEGEPMQRDLEKARWYLDHAVKLLGGAD